MWPEPRPTSTPTGTLIRARRTVTSFYLRRTTLTTIVHYATPPTVCNVGVLWPNGCNLHGYYMLIINICDIINIYDIAVSALTLLVGRREGIRPVKTGGGGGGHWLVRMEWRPAGRPVCLPLLNFPCALKSRSSLLAPAHPGGRGKRVVKRLCGVMWY